MYLPIWLGKNCDFLANYVQMIKDRHLQINQTKTCEYIYTVTYHSTVFLLVTNYKYYTLKMTFAQYHLYNGSSIPSTFELSLISPQKNFVPIQNDDVNDVTVMCIHRGNILTKEPNRKKIWSSTIYFI